MILFVWAAIAADEVHALAWSPGGDVVLVRGWSEASASNATFLTYPRGASLLLPIPGEDLGFHWVNGSRLVVSGGEGTALADLSSTGALPMLDAGYPVVRMDPGQGVLATWSAEGGTRFWVPEPCRPRHGETSCLPRRWMARKDSPHPDGPVEWLADRSFLTAAEVGGAWSLRRVTLDGRELGSTPLPGGPVAMDVGADGGVVVWLAGRTSPWVVWGRADGPGAPSLSPVPFDGPVSAVDLSRDGSVIAVGTPGGEVWARRLADGATARWGAGHIRVRAVTVAPDGSEVAADADGTVAFWSPAFTVPPAP